MPQVLVHTPAGVYRTVTIAQPELDDPDSLTGQIFTLYEAGLHVPEIMEMLGVSEPEACRAIHEARALVAEVLQAEGNDWILPPW